MENNKKKHYLIGACARLLNDNGNIRVFMSDTYLHALVRHNVNLIILTPDNPALEEVMDLCDGFLVPGGGDIDPSYYGENNDEGKSVRIMPRLDTLDKMVVDYCVKHKAPMLGICRGHQSMNVFMGGSMYQDIENHRDIKEGHKVHTIKNKVLDLDEFIETNSYHHQAVKDLGKTFEVVARHEDGTVEAIVSNEYPFIGIQWHPEEMVGTKSSDTIFDKFIEYVKKYSKK